MAEEIERITCDRINEVLKYLTADMTIRNRIWTDINMLCSIRTEGKLEELSSKQKSTQTGEQDG